MKYPAIIQRIRKAFQPPEPGTFYRYRTYGRRNPFDPGHVVVILEYKSGYVRYFMNELFHSESMGRWAFAFMYKKEPTDRKADISGRLQTDHDSD